MYLGAHLHVHYSGAVRTADLLAALPLDKIHQNANGTLTYISEDCPLTPNVTDGFAAVRATIEAAWAKHEYEDKFDVIGKMFYEVIKNKDFYTTYLELLAADMERQQIDHAEYRLALGGMFYYKNGKTVRCTIEDELHVLNKFRQSKLPKLSIAIIAQYSKHKPISAANDYFASVAASVKKFGYGNLVVAFDLVGNELTGRPLSVYRLNTGMTMPYVLHAGENDDDKCRQNVTAALRQSVPVPRLGHGVYKTAADAQRVLDRGIVLEFCPLSMKYLGNWNEDYIVKNVISQSNFTINADDPNKLHDADLTANFEFMTKYCDKKKIGAIVMTAIKAALCTPDVRDRMIERWTEYYA